MAGIGIAAGAVGTVAGGAATAAGIIDARAQRADGGVTGTIEVAATEAAEGENQAAATPGVQPVDGAAQTDATATADASSGAAAGNFFADNAGTIRTAGTFAAGGTAAVGATTAFMGVSQFDALIRDMENCNEAVSDLDRERMELSFEAPDDPRIEQYGRIVEACRGMNVSNIRGIRDRMRNAGIISAVGAAAGAVGGVASVMNNRSEEESRGTNLTANIGAGVATGANAAGAILSGAVLTGLNRNGDIASRCRGAL